MLVRFDMSPPAALAAATGEAPSCLPEMILRLLYGVVNGLSFQSVFQALAASARTFVLSNAHFSRCNDAAISSARITAWLSSP